MFSDLRPDWQVCVTLIVSLFVVCGIAFAVTGRNGKVSGRNLVLIAFAISCLASGAAVMRDHSGADQVFYHSCDIRDDGANSISAAPRNAKTTITDQSSIWNNY